MNSPSSIYYYHGNDDYYTLMVQRHKESGEEGLECEDYRLTEAEAQLVNGWVGEILISKAFRFISMKPYGWTIFLPERKRNVRPLMSPLQRLIEAIGRHPAAESDPEVIDAINAVENQCRDNSL